MVSSQIYKWCSSNRIPEYVGLDDDSDAKISWSDKVSGRPLVGIQEWEPPVLRQYLGEHGRRAPRPQKDVGSTVDGFIISANAAGRLQDIWERNATLYPVNIDGEYGNQFFMVKVNTVLDCLDREQSKGPLQKYGPTPHLFAYLDRWVFHDDCVRDAEIFVIPDSPTIIYASEQFKSRVIDAGLKGVCLRTEWWDENEWHS